MPDVWSPNVINLFKFVAPVPPLLIGRVPSIAVWLKLTDVPVLSTTIPPPVLAFYDNVLPFFMIPVPAYSWPALENLENVIGSVPIVLIGELILQT